MSRILVDQVRSNSASSDALTLDGSGNITVPGNITLSGNATLSGTATGFPKGRAHNLIINGAMQVAQRGTSTTAQGFVIDRFGVYYNAIDEASTYAQADVTSGGAYNAGFRKCLKITNGNQTNGAQAGSRIFIAYNVEAQDMANSGWNYTSSSSYITLSFWVKASVAKSYYGYLYTFDGTPQRYAFQTGSLTADTWTKVNITVPGDSNLQFDNNNSSGLYITLGAYWGTSYTDSGVTLNQWGSWSGGTRTPVDGTSWLTTNDATFEITGIQLEVGDTATDFEHKSFADDLYACQRYYDKSYNYETAPGTAGSTGAVVHTLSTSYNYAGFPLEFSREMRTAPTVTLYSTNNGNTGKSSADSSDGSAQCSYTGKKRTFQYRGNSSSGTGANVFLRVHYQAEAEL